MKDRKFTSLYENELHHLREGVGEFAREFHKIAGRLSLDTDAKEQCRDPFVERLLEGCAYLAARVQLKLDAEFPRFTQSLLETVYPHYLCPTPSMAVVQMEPDPQIPGPPEGILIPRESVLLGPGNSTRGTPCEFRTKHEVRIWPLRITGAEYLTRNMAKLGLPEKWRGRAAIRIGLKTNAGVKLKTLELDRLPVFVRGDDETPGAIFEQIFARASHVVVRTAKTSGNICEHVDPLFPARIPLARMGFSGEEALLPSTPRGFEGYRLVQEYFAMPQRFHFFEFTDLHEALGKCDCEEADLIIVLREEVKESESRLEAKVDKETFNLFCTPIINLFPKRIDSISLTDRFSEYHVVAERAAPLDFEIYQINRAFGRGEDLESEQEFQPFYKASDSNLESAAYFNVHRAPREKSEREKRSREGSEYVGSEVYVSLVDANAAPFRSDLRQLYVEATCTNRHLAIGLVKERLKLDFAAPVKVKCLGSPTVPTPAHEDGEIAWRAISHLSLNYLSLLTSGDEAGPSGLREMLKLYCGVHDLRKQKQIDGLLSASCKPITRPIEERGSLTFGRGLEVTLNFDETAFEGTGIFIFASVLEQFLARYVSLNSFTETVVKSKQREKIIVWPAHPGKKPII